MNDESVLEWAGGWVPDEPAGRRALFLDGLKRELDQRAEQQALMRKQYALGSRPQPTQHGDQTVFNPRLVKGQMWGLHAPATLLEVDETPSLDSMTVRFRAYNSGEPAEPPQYFHFVTPLMGSLEYLWCDMYSDALASDREELSRPDWNFGAARISTRTERIFFVLNHYLAKDGYIKIHVKASWDVSDEDVRESCPYSPGAIMNTIARTAYDHLMDQASEPTPDPVP